MTTRLTCLSCEHTFDSDAATLLAYTSGDGACPQCGNSFSLGENGVSWATARKSTGELASQGAYFHDLLKCCVTRLSYNFTGQTGEIHFPAENCPDMHGCITLFQQLADVGEVPEVVAIQTYVGGHRDTRYFLDDGHWKARL